MRGCLSSLFVSAALAQLPTGSFTRIPSMAVPRMGHSATLLSDGRVLVAGGYSSSVRRMDTLLDAVELYDPTSRTFSPTGRMTTPRAHHAAALLPDGRVLIVGGITNSVMNRPELVAHDLATTEIYDPASAVFSPAAEMTKPRAFMT